MATPALGFSAHSSGGPPAHTHRDALVSNIFSSDYLSLSSAQTAAILRMCAYIKWTPNLARYLSICPLCGLNGDPYQPFCKWPPRRRSAHLAQCSFDYQITCGKLITSDMAATLLCKFYNVSKQLPLFLEQWTGSFLPPDLSRTRAALGRKSNSRSKPAKRGTDQNKKTVCFSKGDAIRTQKRKKRRVSVTDSRHRRLSDGEVDDSGDEYQPYSPTRKSSGKSFGRVLERRKHPESHDSERQNLMELDSGASVGFTRKEFKASLRRFRKELLSASSRLPSNDTELAEYAEFTHCTIHPLGKILKYQLLLFPRCFGPLTGCLHLHSPSVSFQPLFTMSLHVPIL